MNLPPPPVDWQGNPVLDLTLGYGEPLLARPDLGDEVWANTCTRCSLQFNDEPWKACPKCATEYIVDDGPDDEWDRDEPGPQSITDKFLTISQLAALPPPAPLIEGVLDLDNVSIAYGRRGSYKSFGVLDMALCVAAGIPWHDHATTRGTVVYVVGEGKQGVYQRIDAWCSQWPGKDPGDRLLILPEAVNLLNVAAVNAFAVACKDVGASFVIFDTLARCIPGGDENSAKDMGIAVESLDTIRRTTGAHVDAVHHSGKDTRAGARGSSALEGAADTVLEFVKSDTAVTISQTKQKNRAEGEPLRFIARPVRQSVVLDPADNAHPQAGGKIGEALAVLDEIATADEGVTFTEWKRAADSFGVSESSVLRARREGTKNDWIGSDGKPGARGRRYYLTDGGTVTVRGGLE